MAYNSSSLDFSEFPLDWDLCCDSACWNDSSPLGRACARVRPLKLIVGNLQMLAFPTQQQPDSKYHLMSPISVFTAQLYVIWEHFEETMLLMVMSACCKPRCWVTGWLGQVPPLWWKWARADLNAHLLRKWIAGRGARDAQGMLIILALQSLMCSKDNVEAGMGKYQASFNAIGLSWQS